MKPFTDAYPYFDSYRSLLFPGEIVDREKISWIYDKRRLTNLARAIDPSIKLYTKDNWFCKLLAWLLVICTFGSMPRKTFMEKFSTTIGPLHFYPKSKSIAGVLRSILHEGRHTQQARWCSFGIHPWVGLPIYAILYLLTPLPLGFAYLRCWFESDACMYAWTIGLQLGTYTTDYIHNRAIAFAGTVCSGKYGWSLPITYGAPMFLQAAHFAVDTAEKRKASNEQKQSS